MKNSNISQFYKYQDYSHILMKFTAKYHISLSKKMTLPNWQCHFLVSMPTLSIKLARLYEELSKRWHYHWLGGSGEKRVSISSGGKRGYGENIGPANTQSGSSIVCPFCGLCPRRDRTESHPTLIFPSA